MAYGGARTGAGRKSRPTKIAREKRNTEFDEQASAALPELFETIKALATGYKVAVYEKPRKVTYTEAYDEKGELVYVYTVPPDKAAAMYLVDRAAGKANVKSPDATDTNLTLEVMMPGLEVGDAE